MRPLPAMLSTAAAALLALAGCGEEDEPEAAEPPTISVCEAAASDPGDDEVALRGTVVPLSEIGGAGHPGSGVGFVLEEDGCSIFVAGPGREAASLGSGESVEVRGLIDELAPVEADRIGLILGADRGEGEGPAAKGDPGTSEELPGSLDVDTGASFVDAFVVLRENPAG